MICGALQTLNEEAFEDVAGNDLGSGGSVVAPGETLSQQLAPIREASEFSTSMDSGLSVAATGLNNNSILKIGGGGGVGSFGHSVMSWNITNPREDSLVSEGTHSAVNMGCVGSEEELHRPQVANKDTTIIVMSPFTQNMDDTSL